MPEVHTLQGSQRGPRHGDASSVEMIIDEGTDTVRFGPGQKILPVVEASQTLGKLSMCDTVYRWSRAPGEYAVDAPRLLGLHASRHAAVPCRCRDQFRSRTVVNRITLAEVGSYLSPSASASRSRYSLALVLPSAYWSTWASRWAVLVWLSAAPVSRLRWTMAPATRLRKRAACSPRPEEFPKNPGAPPGPQHSPRPR